MIKTIRYQLSNHPIGSFCDAIFIFYALWSLVWFFAYSSNVSFSAISPVFILIIPFSLSALALKASSTAQHALHPEKEEARDIPIVLLFVSAGILLTLFLHRPDADDELYLGMALSLLANPDQAIQHVPGYGSGIHDNEFSGIGAYEPLKAMVSYWTGLPLLSSYYLVVPSLMSALTVIVTYRLLRKLIPDGWLFGMLFFFVVMLAWGDVHRTLANFGYVRMFQGKSVLVSAVVPALFLYFLLAREKTQARYYNLLLAAALVSGIGFSRGGLIMGPFVVGLLGLASINYHNLTRWPATLLVVTMLSATALFVFAYHSGWTLMNPSQLVYTPRGEVSSTTNVEMIEFAMGSGLRGMFLLICVGAGFLFVSNEELGRLYRNYMIIFFVLLLIPWTSDFLAKTLQEYLSWRWLWVVPVPAFASVAVGGALAHLRQVSNSPVAIGAFVVLAVGFTAASPRLVLSAANYTSIQWPGAKLDGHSVYLRPYERAVTIEDQKLVIDCPERRHEPCSEGAF